ncbi:hypothetical protein PRV_02705 [Mycoplasma parvum str. Indiana]|uniref:Uncharacterized protein n=1 Tax=Mycoplasma parvum str. Indiana TaxID=1403316 RepID=U5NGE0_9MOLU|nr:hypothetical protein PRV_02705 [Mycoplasma parvum str. Indiana]
MCFFFQLLNFYKVLLNLEFLNQKDYFNFQQKYQFFVENFLSSLNSFSLKVFFYIFIC